MFYQLNAQFLWTRHYFYESAKYQTGPVEQTTIKTFILQYYISTPTLSFFLLFLFYYSNMFKLAWFEND